MPDIEFLKSLLLELNISLAGEVIAVPSDPIEYLIPVSAHKERDKNITQVSTRKLISRLNETGINYRIITNSENTYSIDNGLRVSLTNSFGDLVRSSVVSEENNLLIVWIELLHKPSDVEISAIEKHISIYASLFSLSVKGVHFSVPDNQTPTKHQIISAVRRNSPVDIDTLTAYIASLGVHVPSNEWLNHRLDAYRRSGLLMRLKSGKYTLTADAIHLLGSNRTSRSPDISRLLAIARGKR